MQSATNKLSNRGEVEDTRLEAKAKNTKQIRGKAKDSLFEDRPSQGQGQECSKLRPRTKDTAATVLQKKGFQKSFLDDFQFRGVPRIFDWGRSEIVACWHVIRILQRERALTNS